MIKELSHLILFELVTICKFLQLNPKVFEKNADIHNIEYK